MDIAISMKTSFWRNPPVLGIFIPIGSPQFMQLGVFIPISKPQFLHLLVSIFYFTLLSAGATRLGWRLPTSAASVAVTFFMSHCAPSDILRFMR